MPRYQPQHADRPGQVSELRGIIFQSDGKSAIGQVVIRPMEALDRWIAGIFPAPGDPPLAMHAGLHVVLEDGREFVAEQLVGAFYMDLHNGLNWTPIESFRQRDHNGWDVTVPATCFRGVDDAVVAETVKRLNTIQGHPFVGEDCTAFVERAFGKRRLFADSPVLRLLGVGARVGDPALPLHKRDTRLDERTEKLLHEDAVKNLPDALADPESANVWLWTRRLAVAGSVGGVLGVLAYRAHAEQRREPHYPSFLRKI